MNNEKLDIHSTTSKRPGFGGVLESSIRKFKTFWFMLFLAPIALLYVVCMGLSLAPAVWIVRGTWELTHSLSFWIQGPLLGMSLAAGFISYGLTLIFVVPLVNKLLPMKPRAHRASWFSLSVLPWYYHNALTYLVRYTFLEIITPTPLNRLFFQMMGMKIGKGSVINTTHISDPCLIEIGDNVTIGGSATLIAHYGMKGILVIDRLVIEDQVTVGLRACIFGDVIIKSGATVRPNEVILPKTRLERGPSSSRVA
jgi:hypothetical protein